MMACVKHTLIILFEPSQRRAWEVLLMMGKAGQDPQAIGKKSDINRISM